MEMEDYEFQVGGHSNKIKINSNNGSTIIKLTNKKEFNFYNNNKDDFLNFNNIFTPIFYGSLKLEGKLNEKGELQTVNQLNLDSDEIEEEVNYSNSTSIQFFFCLLTFFFLISTVSLFC